MALDLQHLQRNLFNLNFPTPQSPAHISAPLASGREGDAERLGHTSLRRSRCPCASGRRSLWPAPDPLASRVPSGDLGVLGDARRLQPGVTVRFQVPRPGISKDSLRFGAGNSTTHARTHASAPSGPAPSSNRGRAHRFLRQYERFILIHLHPRRVRINDRASPSRSPGSGPSRLVTWSLLSSVSLSTSRLSKDMGQKVDNVGEEKVKVSVKVTVTLF